MKMFKQIRVLFLAVLPFYLIGMDHGSWDIQDKAGEGAYIEWFKITDRLAFLSWKEYLSPIIASAFADEVIDFLLDEHFQVKKEWLPMLNLCPAADRHEIEESIVVAKMDRPARVQHVIQMLLSLIHQDRIKTAAKPKTCNVFIVTARDVFHKILGFAIFEICADRHVTLDLLGVIPEAQGRGLSRSLIFSILDPALASETKFIELVTKIYNTRAIAVYEHLGFRVYNRTEVNISFVYQIC